MDMLDDTTLARLMAKVAKLDNGCWEWLGATSRGYAQASIGRKVRQVHRVLYEHFVGPIEPGLQLDHVCHNEDLTCNKGNGCRHRRCVNPAHVVPATPRVNTLRSRGPGAINAVKTRCPKDHPYEGDNLYIDKTGRRHCRECQRANVRRSYRKTDGAAYARAWRAARKSA